MTQHVDPAAEASEIIGALTGLLGGAATLITVLRRKQPDAIPKEFQAEVDALKTRLERVLSEEEGRLGQQRRPNGATTGC